MLKINNRIYILYYLVIELLLCYENNTITYYLLNSNEFITGIHM